MKKELQAIFDAYPPTARKPLLQLRELILEVAKQLPEVGTLEESLKWGQPSYRSKIGTPIRLDTFEEDKIAMLFHCQSNMIGKCKALFSDTLEFSGNRAIVLDPSKPLPASELRMSIEMALTYKK